MTIGRMRLKTNVVPTDRSPIEVETTPTGVLVRFTFPDGAYACAEMTAEKSVEVAATLMFCALRHYKSPDDAMRDFARVIDERGRAVQEAMRPKARA